ncbi:unnamed protein product [Brassica oleracea var. botrytis]
MIKSRDIILQAKRIILTKISSLRHIIKVPKGHFTVYVGEDEEETKRFVVPIYYLKHHLFQALKMNLAQIIPGNISRSLVLKMSSLKLLLV